MKDEYSNYDISDVVDEYTSIDHKQTFQDLFGKCAVDFEDFFKPGDFDQNRSAEHYENLGRTLANLYQLEFEETHGYFKNETDHPVSRACDITESAFAKAMGFPQFPSVKGGE